MIKLSAAKQSELQRLCATLDIVFTYSPDRWHCTFLPLGESSPQAIAAIRRALQTFHAEPFMLTFDRVEGNTLQPRRNLGQPGLFQRAMTKHLGACGILLPRYKFDLHLNLDYRSASDRRSAIPLFSWIADEFQLIESVYGESRHISHERWQLERRQGLLDL